MKRLLIALLLVGFILASATWSDDTRAVRVTYTPTTMVEATFQLDPVTGRYILVKGADAVYLRLMQTVRGAIGDTQNYTLDTVQVTVWGERGPDSTAAEKWDSLWGFPYALDSLGRIEYPLEVTLGDTSLAADPYVAQIWTYNRLKVTIKHLYNEWETDDSLYTVSPTWILDMIFRY